MTRLTQITDPVESSGTIQILEIETTLRKLLDRDVNQGKTGWLWRGEGVGAAAAENRAAHLGITSRSRWRIFLGLGVHGQS